MDFSELRRGGGDSVTATSASQHSPGALSSSSHLPSSSLQPLPSPPPRPRAHVYLLYLTVELPELYLRCHPSFLYSRSFNPRRVLTSPSERCGNGGYDNVHANLVLSVNDVLVSEGGDGASDGASGPPRSFRVLELLGEGTFGQVVKCEDVNERGVLRAVKVIKNKPAYYNQARMEIRLLQQLNTQHDPHDTHHMLRLLHHFTYQHHLCLVFELLSVNLYELMKQNQFRGLAMHLIRTFLQQLTDALQVLRKASVIHCFSEDSRLLTSEGFLFVDEVAPRWRALRFACYNPATRQLEYHPASAFLCKQRGRHAMVDFTAAQAQPDWEDRGG